MALFGRADAATVITLSDSAGVYLVDTTTGAVVQSYGALFAGSSAQNLGQDPSGNLYVTNASGSLLKSTFNASAPTAATAFSAATTIGPISGVTGALARMGFDATTTYCVSGCVVVMNGSTSVLWIDPTTAAIVHSLTTLSAIAGGGDLVVVPTGAASETIYAVSGTALYSINTTTGLVTSLATIAGPTGSLTGLALIPNGDLVACEQKGSGIPWTLWEFTTAGAVVASHTNITTGSDVVNDLASVPESFSTTKTGTAQAGPNDSMTYAITMKNTGYTTIPTGSIVDPIAASIAISAASPPSCAVSGGTGSCTVVSALGAQTVRASVTNLSAGATATLTIVGSPTVASGSATNTGTSAVPFDPSEYGGETLSTNTVTTVFTASEFGKQVANITQGLAPAVTDIGNPGDTLEYTLTFTNLRGFALQNFAISDPIPSNTSYVAGSASCVTTPASLTCVASQSAGVVTFSYSGGSLPPNGVIVAKFRATIQ